MAPRIRLLLLLTACPLGACANAAEQEASALRLALESGRASLAAAAPVQPMAASFATAAPAEPVTHQPAGNAPALAHHLLGLEPDTLRRRLGEPSLRRAEGTAEVWLYAGPACALDLVLYPASGRLRVAHASARASGAEPRTEAHCLQELATGPAAPAPAPTADRGA